MRVTVWTDVDIDLSEIDEEDLIEALEDKGYDVFEPKPSGGRRVKSMNKHEELCEMFGVSRFTTRNELLREISKHI